MSTMNTLKANASIVLHFFMIALAGIFSHSACGVLDDGAWKSSDELRKIVADQFEEPKGCKILHRENRIWIHRDEQAVVVDGYVAQRQVPLELFACPIGTKEHESIVAVFARPQMVHAGLLAVNARPGSTVTFEPFKAAHGTTVRVYVLWIDEQGKAKGTLAQNWIRQAGTKKAMPWDWVFAGSKIYKDDEGKEHYLGDSGELISVSNFTTSTLDVSVKSDQSNSNLMFEAFTERIPSKNTPVRLVLTLTDEHPYSIDDVDASNGNKVEPKHLSVKVPDNILELLVGKPVTEPESKSAEPKATVSKPVASPKSTPRK